MARNNFVTPLSPEEQKKKPEPASLAGLDVDAPAEAPPSSDEYSSIQARVQAMRDAAGPKTDTSGLDHAEQEAKRLYDEKASRSEWLSLAEQVGRSLVRLNAANTGLKYGVDLSGVDLGKGTDWEGRNDRYARDYTTELGRLEHGRNNARLQDRENQDLSEKAMEYDYRDKSLASSERRVADAAKAADERQTAREEAAGKRQLASEAASGKRQDKSLAAQESAADKRMKMQQEFETGREARAAKQADLRDIEQTQTAEAKKLAAKQALFNQLMTSDDLSSKSADKLQAQYGKLAGDADVDLADLQQKLKAEESGPRIFGGRTSDEDSSAKKAILNSEIAKQKNLLDALAERKKQRLGGASNPPPSEDTKIVVEKDGKKFKLPRTQLQEALSQGYKESK